MGLQKVRNIAFNTFLSFPVTCVCLAHQAAEEALCIPCAVGNYSNKIGQAACHYCPKGSH
jgi:hypothetical protein